MHFTCQIHPGYKSMETKGLKIHFQEWLVKLFEKLATIFSIEVIADMTKTIIRLPK